VIHRRLACFLLGISVVPLLPAPAIAQVLTSRLTGALELGVACNNLRHDTGLESNHRQREKLAQRSLFAGARVRF